MSTAPAARAAPHPFNYVIVGGGTAGCILASRLSEDPTVTVALLEAGPSDREEPRAHALRRWDEMVESEYDLDYRSAPQSRGNSGIRQTRSRILGGCSTTNTMIAWRPLASDLQGWVDSGAVGWGADTLHPYFDRILTPITPVAPEDRNAYVADVVASASAALDLPVQDAWNDGRLDSDEGAQARGTGFFEVGYTPATNQRASASLHYIHPYADSRPNLTVMTGALVDRVEFAAPTPPSAAHAGPIEDELPRAHAVTLVDGRVVRAAREVIVCAGSIDTVAVLQRSGVGPADILAEAGVPLTMDLPGVGENLQDHAEGLVVWEAARPVPATRASGWDAGAMLTLTERTDAPDVLMHFPVEPWVAHPEANGVEFPEDIVAIAPNVAKPFSRGRVWIDSIDPQAPPRIDYRYFTDAEGHDERMLVEGVRAARRIAQEEPMASWVVREVFPGPDIQDFDELSRVQRANHQTVYHVSGTCRIGADDDPLAVVNPELQVRGVAGLRIVDASVMPSLTSTNPVVTIMLIAERAADLIRMSNER